MNYKLSACCKTVRAAPLVCLLAVVALSGCATTKSAERASAASAANATAAPSFRFESEPRAVFKTDEAATSRDPKLQLSASGALHVLAVHGRGGGGHDGHGARLGLSISHNGGDTFSPPVPVSPEGARVNSHGENSPVLALTPTEIYALWEQAAGAGKTSELVLARSVNFGHSFERPVRVADKRAPSFNGFPALAASPDGRVYAVWLDGRDASRPSGTFDVYLARSTDRGATFGPNVRVASGACPCCRPAVALGERGEVFVAWRHVYEGDVRDVAVAASRDGGETFDAPARVAADNWRLPGCPHSGPTLAHRAGRLYVSWYTEGGEARAAVKTAWTDDGARTFAPPRVCSGDALDPNHPALSVSADGRVLLAFQGRAASKQDGWAATQVFFTELKEDGGCAPPAAVSGGGASGAYPAVAAGTAGRVFVAWTEELEKANNVLLARGRGN
ncbi:MAG TPA: sialidase family protein [Pyrinomonadaceae bacterium]|nr:sialidase family protein [Pyrinomonadaceae bacterium]